MDVAAKQGASAVKEDVEESRKSWRGGNSLRGELKGGIERLRTKVEG